MSAHHHEVVTRKHKHSCHVTTTRDGHIPEAGKPTFTDGYTRDRAMASAIYAFDPFVADDDSLSCEIYKPNQR